MEDLLAEEQFCSQNEKSILDQEVPEPPQVKEEQQELCINHEGEQHVLNEETKQMDSCNMSNCPVVLPQQHDCKEEEILADQQRYNQEKNSSLDHFEEATVIQYKEEIDHQCPQLNIILAPEIKYRTDLSQQHNCKKEEVLPDQQLCNQERNSSLGWEESEPPQVKEEQQEFCTYHEGEQYVLHEETDSTIVTAAYESNHIEPEPSCDMVLSHNPLPGKKTLKCKFCGKSFPLQWKLNRHQRTHTIEKPFSCKTCGKSFKQNYELTVHTRTHTGERPYSCKICEKCFNQNSDLTVHMRTHTGEKPFSCKACGKGFRKITQLSVHMRIHTGEKPFSCKICGKSFRYDGTLTVHMRTHTGEKPFSCETCGKRFSQSVLVIRHMKTHTDKEPYVCKAGDSLFL